ncbi:type II toxin-antitoxin system RelE/ParE family toxin [Jiella endophytica]|uniref:Type II toxin-antitoxin system RelE/ParE family toxin n=1 Tax=Jiella endophytica TaxID=2558362 RepID=A0A4Y8RLC3_9HYPH|nr:type II toxin-antitoxin system RelE/ParE family toxin [Jiella endophytica]TFF22923.1 type II toxin-antitoxin system RelE/ParE family toxin [Jiella endophytica]
MKRLAYSPQALADLRDIAIYIAEDDPDRAISFVAELERKAVLAAVRPSSFRERSDISAGLRMMIHGRYLIFFRELADEVRIVRFLHGARNLGDLF